MSQGRSGRAADVTAVVILHGDAPQIRQVVDALLAEGKTIGSIDILLLDDGTSPRALLQLNGVPVRIVSLPSGASISTAKNAGLRLSASPFVFFLDDHITLEPGGVSAAVDALRRDPALAGVCGFYRSASGADWNTLRDIKRHSIYGKSTKPRPINLEKFTTFSTGIAIVRRDVFLELDFPESAFPPDFGGEDIPALVTALGRGYRFAYDPRLCGLHDHGLSFGAFLRKIEVEVRGRFSLFYWVSGEPDVRLPYLHGFLNFPLLLCVALLLCVPAAAANSGWLLLIPCALLSHEVALSLRCLATPVRYPLRLRLFASAYVLASDLLTPLCALQYTISSYKRPYARLGVRRSLALLRLFLSWELCKFGLAPGWRSANRPAPAVLSEPSDVELPPDGP